MSRFTTTHWSVILEAGNEDDQRAHKALEHVCERYWYPLYAYVRRCGYDAHAAADATQSFFLHMQETSFIAKADRSAGQFRNFLLASLKRHLLSERKREGAQKRGGGCSFFSLDEDAATARFAAEPADERSPDKLFERNWALNLLDQALALLEREYRDNGDEKLFAQLQATLVRSEDAPSYREIAQALGSTEGAIKVSAHRLRRRYREIVNGLIASTVNDPAEIEPELRHLLSVLS